MNTQSLNSTSKNRSPVTFLLLVFSFSVPLSLLGTVIGIELLPGLPLSSVVVAFCPMMAALVLVYRENRCQGVIELLKRSFDYKRIKAKAWYLPTVLLMPGVMTLEYGLLRLMGSPVPVPQFPVLAPLVMFLAFFFAALGEELGWMGYAIDPMQARSNALQASILLGLIWALWHVIPVVQAGRSPAWIAWQFTVWVASRVLFVWLYNNTGKSVFAAAVYHAMVNVTWQLFPVNGSFYDLRLTGLIVAAVAVIVTFLWGPKTLAHYRYTQSSGRMSRDEQKRMTAG
jgi:membrane protease YdiL (CAAX protease family)